ncbi:integrin alpha-D-like [Actinia tenebrosa]|uniref:Integrin alpha-D-like n=1 Tax=Actinia tenebrosa TaxID=6105 RepID=A0A6P8J0H1_ACTTE|nr:integrin alpha-D-like [Actinia tenebrosa]
MAKAAIIFVLMALVLPFCWSGIWERKPWQNYGRNYLDRYQYIPKKQVTARKLMKYFLNRAPQRLTKRSSSEGVFYDVVFVLDSSGSVGSKEFKNALLALQTLITRAKNDTLYAGITFSTTANITYNFTYPIQAMKNLGKTVYIPGRTNTQEALDKCRTELFFKRESGYRRLSYKRILIVTDGQSNIEKPKTLYNAFRLKNMGIEIFVIAIGKYLKGIAEIVGLASSTDAHLYRVRNMKDLLDIVHLIPPWEFLRQQQKTWLENMFEDMDDEFKYIKKRNR